ncbi:MAG: Bax inhibitor-1/YccA family protein [Actinomycetota bacterium]|nr:Bax inhibitor-1/YccA family protein [Actinomycetota bacterium]
MRSTSNPAFRNLPTGGYGGYAGFQQPQAQGQGYQQPGQPGYGGYDAPPASNDRPMTADDVVTKTGITLGLALITGIITAVLVLGGSISPYPPMIIGLLGGLGLSLVIIFKKTPNPGLVLAYSAFEGVFLGAITGVFEALVPGIAFQAILGTALVFITMLVVYKTGAIKVTPKLTKWIIGATIGAAGLMLVNLVLSMFGVNMGIREAGPLGIGISLLFIGIAAFNFLLDFDMADNMIRTGTPSKYAWYVAFGLMTTLVWLYLEMLRLLYMLNSD